MKSRLSRALCATTVLAWAMSSAAFAQEITGSLRGQVTDENGAAVANATVTVTHVPTGSAITQVTGGEGLFSARGLRAGGPYRVRATAPGFEASTVSVGAIGVGDAANIDVALSRTGSEVDEVVVTAAAAAAPTGGPGINLSSADIEALPSISRDLKDLVRLDPFATLDPTNADALSFAGSNTRFNQLTIDGVRQNDDFGLNNNGYPTQRSPVSLEVIEAVNASAAPYSAINNGFIGGQINAVTRSGGNQFHGSIYGDKTGRDWQGETVRGARAGFEFSEKTWGVTLGGPIIPDRLFFFAGYEKFQGELGFDEGPFDAGKSSSIPRISTSAVDTFRAATKSVYGYDPGGYVAGAFPVEDEKWFAKLDWNLSDSHRLTLAYQNTLGNSLNGSVSSVTVNGNSVTQPRLALTTNQYNKIEELTAYRVQLNSDWTENLSTELRYGFKETDTQQLPLGGLSVGETTVTVADLAGVAAGAGSPQIRFGADINRHDNYLNVKLNAYEALARYRAGPHELLVGVRSETDEAFNVFVANSQGSYAFATYADFLARRASGFTLTGGVDPTAGTVPATLGTARKGVGQFEYRLSSVYAEDRLQVTDTFDITAGIRFDWYNMDDVPTFNAAFLSRNGFSNQQNLDGMNILLPRVSFNWEPASNWKVTGGLGRFSSTGLNVWVSNAFSNNGVNQTNAICTNPVLTNVDLTKVPVGCTFTPGNGNTNVIDPTLAIPSVWKANLSIAYNFDLGRFGNDWLVQLDLLKVINENSLYWRDLRAVQTGLAPDGRPVYSRGTVGTTTGNESDFMLSNLDKGGAEVWAIGIGKQWNQGLFDGLTAKFIYAQTHAEDANPMTSSIAFSSYTRFATQDPERPPAATSDYEERDRFSFDLAYSRKFFGDNKTSIRLYAQKRTGLPFSYTFATSRTGNFDNDFGYSASSYSGRQATSNALFYVPTANDPRVRYAPGFDVTAFNTFLQNSGLAGFAGGIAKRNAFTNPDVMTVDMRFSQELPAFFPSGAKIEVFMDVENLGNLLNDEWGVLEQYDFLKAVPVVNVTCNTAVGGPTVNCGTPGAFYTYSGTGVGGAFATPVKPFLFPSQSLWQIKLGAKFKF
ncbi:TonB-dependent receptor domain-containing protein [Phenylobacterium sp.]|uniref:TonB-dependent receptor n=1 Tax=Phenylobacterium sp. TaxID=1871053 RepID=UPI0035252AC5